jgi:S-formylglutathione hydrolase FrmB
MLKRIWLLFSVLLIAAVLYSCSDRGVVTVDNNYNHGSIFTAQHVFSHYLKQSMFKNISDAPLVRFRVYRPYIEDENQVPGTPFPVLYLLSPYGEDEFFYLDNGLKEVADGMIARHEIKPMWIVCVNGSSGYGGAFYGDTYAGGKYAELIGAKYDRPINDSLGTLLDYVDDIFNTIDSRATRAISGVGTGGYGAMRIAIRYSENFSSVSAISAPLDFNGTSGNGGFVPLFQQVMQDQGSANYRSLDTSSSKPLNNLFIAAACNYSPHDTGTTGDGIVITDSATYFAPFGSSSTIKFHLPFDSTGAVYPPIWNMWLSNNIENILAAYPGALDTTAVFLAASPQADFGYFDQTLAFHDHLTGLNKAHQYLMFNGYSGVPASGNNYTYDMLKKILKFHSDHFIIP